VLLEMTHQSGGDRLPAHGLAFLPEQDQALVRIQVRRQQSERAAAAAGRLGMQPENQTVRSRVVAGSRGNVVEVRQPGVCDSASCAR
jgi:hypothetical protein